MVGGSGLLAVALVYGLHPIVSRFRGEEHNQVFSDGFSAVGTIYAIIAGLLVFGVFQTFDEVGQDSAEAASTLVIMYRDAQAFPQPEKDQARESVVAYLKSVVNDEWPALADGHGSPETSKALDHMYDVYSPMSPDPNWSDQYSNSVSHLDDVTALRNKMIDRGEATLPDIYWLLMFAGGFVTISYLAFSYVESRAMHAVAVGLMAIMLGLVIFLLLEVNHPFSGEISVSTTNFDNALKWISEVKG